MAYDKELQATINWQLSQGVDYLLPYSFDNNVNFHELSQYHEYTTHKTKDGLLLKLK